VCTACLPACLSDSLPVVGGGEAISQGCRWAALNLGDVEAPEREGGDSLEDGQRLVGKRKHCTPSAREGPPTIKKKTQKRLGIEPRPDCSASIKALPQPSHATQTDRRNRAARTYRRLEPLTNRQLGALVADDEVAGRDVHIRDVPVRDVQPACVRGHTHCPP
jgi:hypothetical protein